MYIFVEDGRGVVTKQVDPQREVTLRRSIADPTIYIVSVGAEIDVVCSLEELMDLNCALLSAQLQALQIGCAS